MRISNCDYCIGRMDDASKFTVTTALLLAVQYVHITHCMRRSLSAPVSRTVVSDPRARLALNLLVLSIAKYVSRDVSVFVLQFCENSRLLEIVQCSFLRSIDRLNTMLEQVRAFPRLWSFAYPD